MFPPNSTIALFIDKHTVTSECVTVSQGRATVIAGLVFLGLCVVILKALWVSMVLPCPQRPEWLHAGPLFRV